ncbi:MAG: YbaB/EbfC family nucleoid-associated protein [Nitrospirales bacterium]|nr:YbaB/EbfC family nucleoid-associated protein [Nitrospira sp.]MDR4501051.1 YbaB/EbfC family nucleoid-associated protein [Nitrospirales bacterium]
MSKNPFGNMSNLLKQAQAMQEQMGKIQAEAATKEVEASAGGGMVTVRVTGAMQVAKVMIDPEVMKSEDRDMLQDLLVAATNEALRKAKDMMAEEMKSLTGGIGIPGLSL